MRNNKPEWLTKEKLEEAENILFDTLFEEELRVDKNKIRDYVEYMSWHGYWDKDIEDILLYIEIYKDGEKMWFNIDISDHDSEDMKRLERVFEIYR